MKKITLLIVIGITAMTSGCASYRTNSDISFETTEVKTEKLSKEIKILESGLDEVDYELIGVVDGIVKKLTVFHKNPTKEQVNAVLIEKASKLNADAVINVKYQSGVGVTTWGYMKGTGDAVKLKNK